jgi:hypothetical protein
MLTIRRAREQDFADILKIQAEAFGEYQGLYDVNAWTKETLENINEARLLAASPYFFI